MLLILALAVCPGRALAASDVPIPGMDELTEALPEEAGAYSFRRFAGGTAAGERMANAPTNGMGKSTLFRRGYLPHGRDTPLCVRACIAHGYA